MIAECPYVPILESLFAGANLRASDMTWIMDNLMEGRLSDLRLVSFLAAMRFKSLPAEALVAALESMQRHLAIKLDIKMKSLVDCSGTGGASFQSLNISTMAAVVAASGGAKVAKFGSRGLTSRCGSADVLEAQKILPVSTEASAVESLENNGIAFLYSHAFLPQLKHISQVRKSLGFHTLFDVLVPLANPLNLFGQMVGVYSKDLQLIVGKCLQSLGRNRALVVTSDDGLDEISICGKTQIFRIQDGIPSVEIFDPREFGFALRTQKEITGGGIDENVSVFKGVLAGQKELAAFDAVVINSAGVLWCAGIVEEFKDGIELGRELLLSGRAKKSFERWQKYGTGPVGSGQ
jgi:anthranilate phosphoribosyltransferase